MITYYMNLMTSSIHPFKLLQILIFLPQVVLAWDLPRAIPKPEIKEIVYQDVLNALKKQKWSLAKILADEYKNENLSTLIQWLDITRPGSQFKFTELKNFLEDNRNWPKSNVIRKKIESSINNTVDPKKLLSGIMKIHQLRTKGLLTTLKLN